MTIVESIKCVLQQNNDGLTSKQIYDEIIRQGLYSFGAENPVGVVNAQLRRRCIGLDFPTAYPIKFFEIAGYEGKKINVYALGLDQYTWNEVPNSHQVKDRADKLKRAGLWQKVRDRYLEKKNMYLFRQDHNHPSFVVYVEAVNEVYSRYFNRGGGYSVQSIF